MTIIRMMVLRMMVMVNRMLIGILGAMSVLEMSFCIDLLNKFVEIYQ